MRFFLETTIMTNEIYQGMRIQNRCTVTVNDKPLPIRHDLVNKSAGFEWGFNGAGPAQLALAILAYHCGSDEQRALDNYDEFKILVTAHIPCNTWSMDREYIEQILRKIEHQNRSVV
jgi:hypothetical protein